MKVSQYRELTDTLNYWVDQYKMAASKSERDNLIPIIQKNGLNLINAECLKATARDTFKAEKSIDLSTNLITAHV